MNCTQGHNSLLVKVLNKPSLLTEYPRSMEAWPCEICEKHLKDVPELGKLDAILHVVSKESIQSSTVRSEVPEIGLHGPASSGLRAPCIWTGAHHTLQLSAIRICKIFSNFAVTSLAELIILGGFNEEKYVTSGYFNGHHSMRLAVMGESSCTLSVLKVSTASSLMVLLSVTDFSDRRAAKPNPTCLQCTCFFPCHRGLLQPVSDTRSACSRDIFLDEASHQG